jgi:uncharacterized membrane protein YidH (DUF202 family)
MLLALLALAFGLHTRLTLSTAHEHESDILCSALLVAASILLTGIAARTYLRNLKNLASRRGFLANPTYYNLVFAVVATLILAVVIVAIIDDADDQ